MSDEQYSWDSIDNDAVIIKRTDAVAVYANAQGNIVIRQEGSGIGDEPHDQIVVIPKSRAQDVIKAIESELAKSQQ